MKKPVIAGIVSALSANIIITILEKLVYARTDLKQFAANQLNSEMIPPQLLMQKMSIWMIAALTAGITLSLFKLSERKHKYVFFVVVMFMLTAAYTSLFIMPHPSWIKAALPALFIVPMYLGGQWRFFLRQVPQRHPFPSGNTETFNETPHTVQPV
jgi:hypothetical protein